MAQDQQPISGEAQAQAPASNTTPTYLRVETAHPESAYARRRAIPKVSKGQAPEGPDPRQDMSDTQISMRLPDNNGRPGMEVQQNWLQNRQGRLDTTVHLPLPASDPGRLERLQAHFEAMQTSPMVRRGFLARQPVAKDEAASGLEPEFRSDIPETEPLEEQATGDSSLSPQGFEPDPTSLQRLSAEQAAAQSEAADIALGLSAAGVRRATSVVAATAATAGATAVGIALTSAPEGPVSILPHLLTSLIA